MAGNSPIVKYVLLMDDKASPALKETGEQAEKTGKAADETGRSFDGLASMAVKMAGALLAAGTAVVGFAQKMADVNNLLTDMSTRTGINVKTLAGLRLAARGSGLSFESLSRNLSKIPQLMADAERGTVKTIEAFRGVGIEAKELEGASPDEVFKKIMLGLAAIPDAGQRAVRATDLLGASGTRMLQALGDPGQLQDFINFADEFGTDVGPAASAAAGEWERAMADLGMVAEAAGGKMFAALTGAGGEGNGLTGIIDDLAAGVVFLTNSWDLFVASLNVGMTALQGLAILLTGSVSDFREWKDETLAFSLEEFNAGLDKAADKTNKFRREQKELREAGGSLEDRLKGLGSGMGGLSSKTDKAVDSLAALHERMADVAALFEASVAPVENNATRADGLRDSLATLTDKLGLGMSALEQYKVLLLDLDLALARNTISATEYAEGVDTVQEAIKRAEQASADGQAEQSASTSARLSESSGGLQSAVVDGLVSAMNTSGGELLTRWGSQMGGFMGTIMGVIGGLVGAISGLAEGGEKTAEALWDKVTTFFEGLFQVDEFIIGLVEGLAGALEGILVGFVENLFDGSGSGLVTAIGKMLLGIVVKLPLALMVAIADGMRMWWTRVWLNIQSFIQDVFSVKDDLKEFGEKVGKPFKEVGEKIGGFFKNVGSSLGFRQSGGYIPRTQLALVHQGERITQRGGRPTQSAKSAMGGMGGGGAPNINVSTMVMDPDAIPALMRQIERVYGPFGRATSPMLTGV